MARTDIASRVIAASPERVYAAFVDLDALVAWLPPAWMSGRFEQFVSDDPRYAGTMTMTWEVATVEAGSRVEFRADDVPDGISAEDHAAGLTSSLTNLATYLER